jgi:hypothetical protein
MYEPAEYPEAATGRWEEERKWETVGAGNDFEGVLSMVIETRRCLTQKSTPTRLAKVHVVPETFKKGSRIRLFNMFSYPSHNI